MDLLLHRYTNIEYIMSLDLETGLGLIKKAKYEQREERLRAQWIGNMPIMALSGNAISYEDYRAEVLGLNIDRRPTNMILAELENIEKQFEEGG